MLETLFWLLVGHAVGDFGLQSDWMAKHKNRHVQEASALSSKPGLIWIEVLAAHSLIHAGAVALATGSILLGVLEFIAHWIIDYGKCEDWFGFHTDQGLHILSKFIWLGILALGWV
ncbi:MAG: DUF3307 domain-containing protein [Oceanococcus sp.]